MQDLPPIPKVLRDALRRDSAYVIVRVALLLVAISSVVAGLITSAQGRGSIWPALAAILAAVVFFGLASAILDIADSALLMSHKPLVGDPDQRASSEENTA